MLCSFEYTVDCCDETQLFGSYFEQPVYVKAACWLAYLSCVDLLIFVPISAGTAVIGGVGTPASSTAGIILPFMILFGMLTIGAWINDRWLGWLPGKELSKSWRWFVFAVLCMGSVGASTGMVLAHLWPTFFACFVAFVPIGLVSFYVATKIKQAFRGAT